MAVYVDEIAFYAPSQIKPAARKYGCQWAHLTADSVPELLAFARALGMPIGWFQRHPRHPHFDVTPKWRGAALRAGAIPLTREQVRLRLAGQPFLPPAAAPEE